MNYCIQSQYQITLTFKKSILFLNGKVFSKQNGITSENVDTILSFLLLYEKLLLNQKSKMCVNYLINVIDSLHCNIVHARRCFFKDIFESSLFGLHSALHVINIGVLNIWSGSHFGYKIPQCEKNISKIKSDQIKKYADEKETQ